LRMGQTNAIVPFEFDPLEHGLGRERAELQDFEEQAAEMTKRGSDDRSSLLDRSIGKCGCDILLGGSAMRAQT